MIKSTHPTNLGQIRYRKKSLKNYPKQIEKLIVSKTEPSKILFWGTTAFGVPTLEALLNTGYEIIAIITSPDKPTGRKQIITPPPIKAWLQNTDCRIQLFQPQKLDSSFKLQVSRLGPDIGIVASYGKIIPKEILGIPKYGFINIHPSLLPKYRGPTPIQTAILNGEVQTGITIILMDEQIDHGNIISNFQFPISKQDTYQILHEKLAKSGAELLISTLPRWISGKIKSTKQNHKLATFTKKFKFEDGKINWLKTSEEINCQIKALNPEPGTWALLENKKLKILEAKPDTEKKQIPNGTVFKNTNGEIAVQSDNGSLVLISVQKENNKIMTIQVFINGQPKFVGSKLG